MNLMPNEEIILSSPDDELTLTTHRVRHHTRLLGGETTTSIMLEEIASIQLARQSNPALLLLAALCGGVGILLGTSAPGNIGAIITVGGVAVAIVLVLAYLSSRRQIISLASAGGVTINMHTQGMKIEDLMKFIDRTEEAKNDRYIAFE